MFFTYFAMDVIRLYLISILCRYNYDFGVRFRVAGFFLVAVLRLVVVALLRRAPLAGASDNNFKASSWVILLGSVSFGILAFFLPSVMYGP